MNKYYLTILLQLCVVCIASAQGNRTTNSYSFIKSSEFKEIRDAFSKLEFNYIEGVWFLEILDDANPEITSNTYEWATSDSYHKMFLWNNLLIVTYHLAAGSNTGTLIYDRNTKKYKEFFFFTNNLLPNSLDITREWYDKGHRWQSGKLNLNTYKTVWSKKIER